MHSTIARELQKMILRPSTRYFINMIEENLLKKCPVTQQDILIAEDIFGPDIKALKGKIAQRKTGRVDTF